MTVFTHTTINYENHPAYMAYKTFFDSYLRERNYEKTLSLLEDDFYCFGIGENKVSSSKEEFKKVLQEELDILTVPLEYNLTSVHGKEIVDRVWVIMTEMDIMIPDDKMGRIVYTIRCTGGFRLHKNGFAVISIHLSKPSVGEEKEFLLLENATVKQSIGEFQAEQIVFDIISKSIPGGVISGYAQEGFPLYFVNDRYLELLGYTSYEEFNENAKGLGINHIHPDDINKVNKEIMVRYNTDTQYGLKYRMRHKNGHYIHVYDIGKKMITPDGKEIIICIIYDMTEDVKLRELLAREASNDALTGVYNRRGGIRAMECALEKISSYTFAFFDIDNLKLINDRYSHTAGDHALQYFAKLLMEYFDNQTVLARIGGDEFIAFFRDKLERQRIECTFSKLEQGYYEFIKKNYPKSHSSVSIGCIIGTKKCRFDELYQITDRLMYDIKDEGKNGFKIVELD